MSDIDLDTDLPDDEGGADELVIAVSESGLRLDKYLAENGDFSRAFVQKLIDESRVLINGQPVKASRKTQSGQDIRILLPPPPVLHAEPEPIDLEIIYEDEDLLVVNKPRGMVVHPAPGHLRGTLVNALLWHFGQLPERGGEERPGIVHRIDKDTSGLLVVAKTDLAHQGLSQQLKDHTMTRIYEAIVHGVVAHERGRIDAPIGRHPQKRQQMAVRTDGNGRHAVTHFHVLESFRAYTHLELRLETGRTHQIRVHLAYIGHSVIGDPVYATKDPFHLNGQALHAGTLGFVHPRTGIELLFKAPIPDIMENVLQSLRLS